MAQKEKKKVEKVSEDLQKEMDKISEIEEKKDKAKKEKDNKKKKAAKEEKTVVKKESWWQGAKSEIKKVKWPTKKEMIKYSIATITFIIFFALFFFAIEMIVYLIRNA